MRGVRPGIPKMSYQRWKLEYGKYVDDMFRKMQETVGTLKLLDHPDTQQQFMAFMYMNSSKR